MQCQSLVYVIKVIHTTHAPRTAAQLLAARQADERNKGVIFKNYAPFTNWKSEINNNANKKLLK